MTIIYRAFDGEEFMDECECIAHEEDIRAANIKDYVHLWDEDKDEIEVNGDIFANFDDVMFFRCDNDESYKIIFGVLEQDGYTKGLPPNGAGIVWMWVENGTRWQPIENEINLLQEQISNLMSLEGISR